MNASPWDTTGPSQYGTHFYTPGWSPKIVWEKAAPKPSPLNAPKPLDFDAVKAYRATHTMVETAEHFGCTQRHLYRRYYDAVKADPITIDRMEVHAYRMSGKSLRACEAKFHIGKVKLRELLEGLPQLVKPQGKPRSAGIRPPKLVSSYTVSITEEQREIIAKHGGAAWVRSLIDQAAA